jgi:hypothetical protein
LSEIAERLLQVQERIRRACVAAAREPGAVRLLAVSKTKPARDIRDAYAAGQRDFGENYPQELATKAQELSDLRDIRWHMIGHVQTNKAKLAARDADWVHSVDSTKLVQVLGRRRSLLAAADTTRKPLAVLVEVNVSGELQKAGCSPGDLGEVLAAIEAEPMLALRGLMTVPPNATDPETARPHFSQLHALQQKHGGAQRLAELSMGMSHDLEVAVAEGSSIVRIGTAIFGPRQVRTGQKT